MKNEDKDKINKLASSVLSKLKPPPRMSVSEWAEENFYLSSEYSANPGRISMRVTPYLREILDTINDPKINKVSWIASAQVAKTTALMIAASYFIAYDPSPILFLEPTDELAEAISTERFVNTIRDNQALRRVFSSKESTNNKTTKLFPGGALIFGSAGSPSKLISRPVRVVILDEVDKYKADLKDAGNPIVMAESRTNTFPNKKVFLVSTPGIEGLSNIMDSYSRSDMRVYKVPCPHCNHFQELQWKNIKKTALGWKGATYECENCSKQIQEYQKSAMVQAGRWEITNPNPKDEGHAGFKINQLYSLFPNTTWESIGKRMSEAKAKHDKADLKTITNEVLAETWFDKDLANISDSELAQKAEIYNAQVPLPVGILTAGIDFQANRVEITVLGHAKNNQKYLIDHRVIHGDTNVDPNGPSGILYRELEAYLNQPFKHESGRDMYIWAAFADVGDGVRTYQQRKFCFPRYKRRIFASRGHSSFNELPYSGKTVQDRETKFPIYFIGVSQLKQDIYNRFTLPDSSLPGYIHFPRDAYNSDDPKYSHLNSNYYKQLTSEKFIQSRQSGVVTERFKTIGRNEALDCMVYAMAVFVKEFGYRMDQFEATCDLMALPLDPSEIQAQENQAQENQAQEGKGQASAENKPESIPAPQAQRRQLTWAEKKQLALSRRNF